MILVGLTGTSGSGKGYVSSLFARRGIMSVDTDKITHELYIKNKDCIAALTSSFGSLISKSDGTVDRRRLAEIVFSDTEKLALLNHIVHRFVLDEARRQIAKYEGWADIVLVDAPQLFESGFDRECDCTLAVIADVELRISRICIRDNKTREQALARIKNQHDDEFFAKKCDYVIVNNGSEALDMQIDEIISKIRQRTQSVH